MKLLEGAGLRERLSRTPPLVEGFLDREVQIQMNGVDFTLREVSRFGDEPGAVDFDNSERRTASTEPIPPGRLGVVASRSSSLLDRLQRSGQHSSRRLCSRPHALDRSPVGAQIGTALWDSGYSGRSGSLLTVSNPAGIRIKKDARVLQLVFFELDSPAEKTYAGRYQNENK